MDRIWFGPLSVDGSALNFVPTFPRRISGFMKCADRLFVVLVNGEYYEVHRHYFEPRPTFAEWARTH